MVLPDHVMRDAAGLADTGAGDDGDASPAPSNRNLIQPFKAKTKCAFMSCQCQPVSSLHGWMARMCLPRCGHPSIPPEIGDCRAQRQRDLGPHCGAYVP